MTVADHEKGRGAGAQPTVLIIVDEQEFRVRPGQWGVRDLKAAVGIDPAKVLAEITPHGLKDFDDDGHVDVHPGARFMSHVRSGGSS